MKSLYRVLAARQRVLAGAVTVLLMLMMSTSAHAWRYYTKLSDVLDSNGFGTLKFALDTTNLTSVLDENRVTLFAPTDDVFEATAAALGCSDALDLATRLINLQVGDTDALTAILTYHATLYTVRGKSRLLRAGSLHTVNGGSIQTGVNQGGLFVQGDANATASQITVDGISGYRWVVYPINQILLPIAPPADLCS
ncbi:hypothetical protein FKG94_01605 [Exilibacterium tricleocarpae]|uniref:FAS1 domain-containing protein n=1 Tax=Exilibacterium tricleocarpae TaxID=2591008 RepID=A0A545UA36_9GAMM|nr:fasciclin domain-containing protein [Exilibacterium tricleocarpae]TQV86273.1 hypothetical protein FKG94_01605 [Exilibacterium tricleocarpae]